VYSSVTRSRAFRTVEAPVVDRSVGSVEHGLERTP
jgi:hypothetical protein